MTRHDDEGSATPPSPARSWSVDVALVPWPTGHDRLAALRTAGLPRLLLVPEGVEPPETHDVLEDWLRTPADPRDVQARAATLSKRARGATIPRLDDNGRLHAGSRWVALSPTEARLAAALLHAFGSVVSRDDLTCAGWPDRRPTRNQLDVQMVRLRRRVEPLGFVVQTVRGHGFAIGHAAGVAGQRSDGAPVRHAG